MFNKILVANRGEIACRVIKSARKMGIKTVAVYSDADVGARHVELADEAMAIGPAPASQSYLLMDNIIDAALKSGAEAIHPGYGFLSENAGFARVCQEKNIVFIGPPVGAIEAMGSKSEAKQIMQEAGVPLVPGYHGKNQTTSGLLSEAQNIGFPVLIKASAGGGGKGMRIVHSENEFEEGLESAKREALSSFSDDHVLIEKYLTRPRHIEIQVFCDNKGNAVHLFERDCSVQRRHQKILEEAPAPGMSSERRNEMGQVAITAANAINYVGAGTVEFIVDEDGTFYFMEMNTRLQVEHPVTELITGQDLVEWQLKVAAGQTLPCEQSELSINGHALEARIYAEDPARDFLPATGRISHLRFPHESTHTRIDTGVRQGDTVSMHYDPMIAKLIAWDHDRNSCLRRMQGALAELQVVGLTTNTEFLSSLVSHSAFQAGEVDTGFIDAHHNQLFPDAAAVNDSVLALACLYLLLRREEQTKEEIRQSGDPSSPWHLKNAWKSNLECLERFYLKENDQEHKIEVLHENDDIVLMIANNRIAVSGDLVNDSDLSANLNDTRTHATVVEENKILVMLHGGRHYQLECVDKTNLNVSNEATTGSLTSPMPGKVISVLAGKGNKVEKGQPLIILEAMKMEHTIIAPVAGVISSIHFKEGDMLDEGVELLVIEE